MGYDTCHRRLCNRVKLLIRTQWGLCCDHYWGWKNAILLEHFGFGQSIVKKGGMERKTNWVFHTWRNLDTIKNQSAEWQFEKKVITICNVPEKCAQFNILYKKAWILHPFWPRDLKIYFHCGSGYRFKIFYWKRIMALAHLDAFVCFSYREEERQDSPGGKRKRRDEKSLGKNILLLQNLKSHYSYNRERQTC